MWGHEFVVLVSSQRLNDLNSNSRGARSTHHIDVSWLNNDTSCEIECKRWATPGTPSTCNRFISPTVPPPSPDIIFGGSTVTRRRQSHASEETACSMPHKPITLKSLIFFSQYTVQLTGELIKEYKSWRILLLCMIRQFRRPQRNMKRYSLLTTTRTCML
jgi:hypothetical protein